MLMALAACDNTNTEDTLPTRVSLSDLTATVTDTVTTPTMEVAATVDAPTLLPTLTATPSPQQSSTPSVTPSSTITNTPSRTPTSTVTPTLETFAINLLAQVALSATVLPPDFGAGITPDVGPLSPPTAPPLAITPTTAGPVQQLTPVTCPNPVPGEFAAVATPDLTNLIGCPINVPTAYNAATQTFERGTMIWLSPGTVYVLYNTGSYGQHTDTFDPNIDPESDGLAPPAGLLEPMRGFGKVWHSNESVRSGLGWATNPESGTSINVLDFTQGRMLALPGGQIYTLIQPGSTWR
jgi:hypothetical protein